MHIKNTLFGTLVVSSIFVLFSTAYANSWSPTLLVNTESFQIIDEGDGTTNVNIQFGDTLSKNLTYDRVNTRFSFDDDVYIGGSLAATSSITISADQIGDATLVFGSSLVNQNISLLNNQSVFRFSTGAIINGSLTASSAIISSLQSCSALTTNSIGEITCSSGATSPESSFINVTSNTNSIASGLLYDVFQNSSYLAPSFITNSVKNIVFTPASGTFAVQKDGTYLVIASIIGNISTSNNVSFIIQKNGVAVQTSTRIINSGSDPVESTVQIALDAVVGDTFEVLLQSQNAARTVAAMAGTTVSIVNISSSGGSGLAPYIAEGGGRVDPSSSTTLVVTGNNFDYDTIVEIPSWPGTIDDVRHNSATEIEIDVTAGATEAIYDLVLKNGSRDSTDFVVNNGSGAIQVATSAWLDLRLGGDSFTDGTGAGNDIRYRTGMSLGRDANGMFFNGGSPWSSWVKFESLAWTRGSNQTLEWIFTNPSVPMMIGIGSDATNEASTSQFQEAEVEAYFQNATTLWGLYGNNGTPGIAGFQNATTAIPFGGVFKIKFENDGDAGDTFTLYQIPSANPVDWDNESTVLSTLTIGGTLNPNEANIMPFIIPANGGTQRFIAVKVE